MQSQRAEWALYFSRTEEAIQHPHLISSSEDSRWICTEKSVVCSREDVVIVGFYPLYSWELFIQSLNDPTLQQQNIQINLKKYQLLLILLLAVEEINKNPHLLPNMTLGFEIYTAHYSDYSDDLSTYCQLMDSSTNVIIFYGDSKFLLSFIVKFGHILITRKVWVMNSHYDDITIEENYNIYNAVYALAHALHQMFLCHMEEPLGHNGQSRAFLSSQLHPFLKKIQFTNPVGDQVVLNEERKLEAEYDIKSFWNFPEGLGQRVKVGEFSPSRPYGQQLILFENLIEWPIGITKTPQSVCTENCGSGYRKASVEGNATCCFDCILCPENEISNADSDSHSSSDMEPCVRCADHQFANTQRNHCLMKTEAFLAYEDPLGLSLVCAALCCSALTAAVLGGFIKHQDTPIVKANNRALSYILLISLTCCFLCSLLFLGRPNTATCILQHTTFAVVFTVAVSTVPAKIITVLLAFTLTDPGRSMRLWLLSGAPNLIITICTLIQVTLCGLWLGISPPFVDIDAHSEHGHIIILCNMSSLTAFFSVLGYLGALALASFTVAFLVRNLPDTFNEAKFLTFSMLMFCSMWLTFLPVYHSTKVKVMVAVEVFILASSGGLLSCIFAPKCYIVLIRPERNSLHRYRERTTERNKS
ncbi:vomeronasal type-2 receptor 116-like [Dipodomys spectabilis]|uniref:vomeronasal type-2 receptor 116-like n=1 Tax=Dipodomys spectabilis TaxID=105255 RepID=UPI001C547B96|nr:vomeronasal type-2 receptor 116-like [Dipodomys spectabilis]